MRLVWARDGRINTVEIRVSDHKTIYSIRPCLCCIINTDNIKIVLGSFLEAKFKSLPWSSNKT